MRRIDRGHEPTHEPSGRVSILRPDAVHLHYRIDWRSRVSPNLLLQIHRATRRRIPIGIEVMRKQIGQRAYRKSDLAGGVPDPLARDSSVAEIDSIAYGRSQTQVR